MPIVDNYGAGKVFLEGNAAHFIHPSSCQALIFNHSSEATIAIQQVASMHGLVPNETSIKGIKPQNLHCSGYL